MTVYRELVDAGIDIRSTSPKKLFEYMKRQKICKRQCQRIFDILGCYEARKSSLSQYKKYFADIKNRITADIEVRDIQGVYEFGTIFVQYINQGMRNLLVEGFCQ